MRAAVVVLLALRVFPGEPLPLPLRVSWVGGLLERNRELPLAETAFVNVGGLGGIGKDGGI